MELLSTQLIKVDMGGRFGLLSTVVYLSTCLPTCLLSTAVDR